MKSTYFLRCILECPEFDGGSVVTQYEVNVINPDRTSRIVYTGFDCECLVASLLPGRSYSFQVRASNKIGVTILSFAQFFSIEWSDFNLI